MHPQIGARGAVAAGADGATVVVAMLVVDTVPCTLVAGIVAGAEAVTGATAARTVVLRTVAVGAATDLRSEDTEATRLDAGTAREEAGTAYSCFLLFFSAAAFAAVMTRSLAFKGPLAE